MKKSLTFFLIFIFVTFCLIFGYWKWFSHIEAPYQWLREGGAYTNAYYDLQITKRDEWVRYTEAPSLGAKLFFSQVTGNPAASFKKRNLIEFHRFGDDLKLDAVVFVGSVDDLKDKRASRSLEDYAKGSMENIMAMPKMWLMEGNLVEISEIGGEKCARVKTSASITQIGDMEMEGCLFIKDGKGFSVGYSAVPESFDTYRNEAWEIVQSFRFTQEGKKKKVEAFRN